MDKKIEKFEFRVIDNNTGEEADIEEIAFTEDWAEGLIYCDMEGFAILEDGNLVLLDECGNCAYCPNGRFSIIPEGAVVLTREEYDSVKDSVDLLREYESVSNSLIKSNELCRKLVEDKKELKRQLKQAGKETAEKFAERLKEKFPIYEDGFRFSVPEQIHKAIDEICKEIIGEEK